VDYSVALESIARSLPGLPEPALDSSLIAFDALVALSDNQHRPAAAQFLREASALCQDRACAARLLRAAEDVTAGRPCALTPEGLTGQQASAAQTMSMEVWQQRPDLQDEPPPREEEAPSLDALESIWDRVEDCLCAAEDEDEGNDLLEAVREDVEEAKAWLSSEDDRGPAPPYASENQVAEFFGPHSEMSVWMRELFAGMSKMP